MAAIAYGGEERRTGNGHRNGLYRRIGIAPFEICTGLMAVWQGMSSLFEWSLIGMAHNLGVPPWTRVPSSLFYMISGITLVAGVIYRRRSPRLEGYGLVMLATSFIFRIFAFMFGSGWTLITSDAIIKSAVFTVACVVRLSILWSGRLVILAEVPRKDDKAEAVTAGVL